jgi:hypothetical protein
MNTFKKGDKVRINYPESDWNGRICTYNQPDAPDETVVSHLVVDDFNAHKWIQTRYLEVVTVVHQDEYADMSLEEQVAVLSEEMYNMSRVTQMHTKSLQNLQHDLDHYDRVMRETKDDQGWCDEGTNKVIEALNDGFLYHSIEPYESEFEVEYEITASVIIRGTHLMMASSQEAADEFFSDDPDSYITPETLAKEAVTYGDWDNIEVEVI